MTAPANITATPAIAFSQRAIARMTADDADFEAWARRNKVIRHHNVYGFKPIWRDLETGTLRHTEVIYATRAEAYGSNALPGAVLEGIDRVCTNLETIAMYRPERLIPVRVAGRVGL